MLNFCKKSALSRIKGRYQLIRGGKDHVNHLHVMTFDDIFRGSGFLLTAYNNSTLIFDIFSYFFCSDPDLFIGLKVA